MKKKLPLGLSTFSNIIKDNYLYVDKTEQIFRLFSTGERYFFLSRPRRFGKSLLLSTLDSLFRGERELFANLWIGKQKDFDWQKHPVIHLDISEISRLTPEALEKGLMWKLSRCAQEYNVSLAHAYDSKTMLITLVEELAKNNSVAILIDEYDKPILDNLHNPEKANQFREALKHFYETLKALDKYLRCIFITGVSKFSKASVFSGLNNLSEISYLPQSADLLGYTQAELNSFFDEYLTDFAHKENESVGLTKEKIKLWYNGYQFSEAPIKVYNPFSIAHLFNSGKFKNYWFESGTPSFLIEYLKRHPFNLRQMEQKVFDINTLGTFLIENLPLETLFFQSGYLTIKNYDKKFDVYTLDYPNAEIMQSMALLELGALTNANKGEMDTYLYKLRHSLVYNDLEVFTKTIQILLANIPSYLHIEREAYYHSLIQLLCTVLGLNTTCEVSTSKGRIDLVLTTEKYIYVIELKFDASAQKALEQILEKKYYEKYLAAGKEIVLVGMAFNYQDKELTVEWVKGKI